MFDLFNDVVIGTSQLKLYIGDETKIIQN
jgi:hypothetical protein